MRKWWRCCLAVEQIEGSCGRLRCADGLDTDTFMQHFEAPAHVLESSDDQ